MKSTDAKNWLEIGAACLAGFALYKVISATAKTAGDVAAKAKAAGDAITKVVTQDLNPTNPKNIIEAYTPDSLKSFDANGNKISYWDWVKSFWGIKPSTPDASKVSSQGVAMNKAQEDFVKSERAANNTLGLTDMTGANSAVYDQLGNVISTGQDAPATPYAPGKTLDIQGVADASKDWTE